MQELDRKANVTSFWEARLREAFYAGAEAGIDTIRIPPEKDNHDVQAEIDHFKNRPK